MEKLSSLDRCRLIRLASKLRAGSPQRRAILAGLVGPVTCSPTSTSAAWIDPAGKAHELGGLHHEEWAARHLKNDPDFDSHDMSGWEHLMWKGWVRYINFRALDRSKTTSPRALAKAAELIVECVLSRYVDQRLDPNVEGVDVGMATPGKYDAPITTPTIADFVARYGGRALEDKLFEGLMMRSR